MTGDRGYAPRIEDYAMIGDCGTAALVSKHGSIDWLCWPRFDSAACFAALLGTSDHGRWLIAPADPAPRVSRRYRNGTLILETLFETGDGSVALIDFMPPNAADSSIVRIVEGRRGAVEMRMHMTLRFDYGASVPWVTRLDDETVRAIVGPDMAILRTQVRTRGEDLSTVAKFSVSEGQSVSFVLTHGPSHLELPAPVDPGAALSATEAFWTGWSSRCDKGGEWRDAVTRSLVTLKALTYGPTGGIVAAPTTSLPEQLGGSRNWDYRFCWLRDATLTLLAMIQGGFLEEAKAWREWLHRSIAGSPGQIQIMYGLAGERRLAEWEVPWLPGYQGAKPVRIGNAASSQLQLDVYGELMDTLYQARKAGLESQKANWDLECHLVRHLEGIWDQADEGIWEIRGDRQHFTYSNAMAWVAFDRAIRTAEEFRMEGPIDRWKKVRQRIHDSVCQKGFNTAKNSFVQHYGTDELDASLLLLPETGFLPADDPRIVGTVAAVERELMQDGLIKRYRTSEALDGLPPGEGMFLACSFWYADILVLQNRYADARSMFERLLSLRNDVGLLAEEYDTKAGRLVGNFPQAFSHVAMVDTAFNLTEHGPAKQRAET